ncbi:NAD(P)-dependent oxidoreductase [Chryseobacterium potabilaquae]|uniref:Hydroxypyruvate reductase n=1 Tax=Chryseobacterium potabilaquae TaxID=2675057 RepID=A0A6N4X5X5_9FLAO|nr:NAD(P)-dependent oxidoreductase [Chryseobacterium potabilaquae]CAA7196348.1 Hydroxypyruvate reductase [Chryseobacterium potabilaquae]
MKKHKILLLDKIAEKGLDQFKEFSIVDDGCILQHDEIKLKIAQYDGIIFKSGNRINNEILNNGINLKFLARAGSGVDNIDLNTLDKLGIRLFTSAEGNARCVAEYVLGTMILMSHRLFESHLGAKMNNFQRHIWQGRNINDLNVGIIGYGGIGQEVTRLISPLCKSVLVFTNKPVSSTEANHNVRFYHDIKQVVSHSNVITIHTSLNPTTEYLFNESLFNLMPKGSILINTARGKIIDDRALLQAFNNGTIVGAVLDSLYPDPHYNIDPVLNTYNHFLIHHPNVFYTPHIAAGTRDALEKVSIDLAHKIKYFLNET